MCREQDPSNFNNETSSLGKYLTQVNAALLTYLTLNNETAYHEIDMEFFVRYKIVHERFESVPLGTDLQIIHNIVHTATLCNLTKQEIKHAHCNLIMTWSFIEQ